MKYMEKEFFARPDFPIVLIRISFAAHHSIASLPVCRQSSDCQVKNQKNKKHTCSLVHSCSLVKHTNVQPCSTCSGTCSITWSGTCQIATTPHDISTTKLPVVHCACTAKRTMSEALLAGKQIFGFGIKARVHL